MRIKKEDVLKRIGTCHELESIWHNDGRPSSTFRNSVVHMRAILESLLTCSPEIEIKDAD